MREFNERAKALNVAPPSVEELARKAHAEMREVTGISDSMTVRFDSLFGWTALYPSHIEYDPKAKQPPQRVGAGKFVVPAAGARQWNGASPQHHRQQRATNSKRWEGNATPAANGRLSAIEFAGKRDEFVLQ